MQKPLTTFVNRLCKKSLILEACNGVLKAPLEYSNTTSLPGYKTEHRLDRPAASIQFAEMFSGP